MYIHFSSLAQFKQRYSEDFDDPNVKNLIESNQINRKYPKSILKHSGLWQRG